MKRVIKFLGIAVGVIVLATLMLAGLGYAAIRYNFWPPFCEVLGPIRQAKRVCEFSKLEQAKVGIPAQVTYWLTVDPEIKDDDRIFLVIRGRQAVKMEKVGNLSYQATVPASVGDVINYSYYKNYDQSHPNMIAGEFGFHLKSKEKTIYDAVPLRTYFNRNFKLPQRIIHNMFDTWSINYNFNFFENTRWNIASSMERAKALGADEFGVYSFIEVLGDKNNFTIQEIPTPFKYHRDAAITEKDMMELARLGKQYGLDVVIHYNMQADYSKYFNLKDIRMLGKGVQGASSHQRAANDLGVYEEQKSRAWTKMWFDGLEKTLLTWAERAEKAGIYGIDITPQYMVPKMAPEEKYADERFSQMIANIRKVYHGKIFGSTFGWFGGITSFTPQYINNLDGLYVYDDYINVPKAASLDTMRAYEAGTFDKIEVKYKNYPHDIFIIKSQGSYSGANNGVPPLEFNDYVEVLAKGYKDDWQGQADAYEAFFEALNGRSFFKGVGHSGYWWDDLMNPKYADPLISMHFTIRNKPAEAVWKKWAVTGERK